MGLRIVEICPPESVLSELNTNVQCPEEGCGKTFAQTGALKMHFVKTHGRVSNDSDKALLLKQKKESNTEYHYHCPVTGCYYQKGWQKFFSAFKYLKQHYMRVHYEKSFHCDKCDNRFGLEKDLIRHKTVCGMFYYCDTCNCRYKSKPSLQSHCNRKGHKMREDITAQLADTAERSENKSKPDESTSGSAPEPRPSTKKKSQTALEPPNRLPIQVLVLGIPVPDPPPKAPRPIQPKPVTQSKMLGSKVIVSDRITVQPAAIPVRQNATIQTEIFGVKNLSVSRNFATGSARGQVKRSRSQRVSAGSQATIPLSSGLNSNLDIHNEADLHTVERSTTGMQTHMSMSMVKPRKHRISKTVMATQTSGDHILEKAMASADIPIQQKNVASQVTPQKFKSAVLRRRSLCSSETQTTGNPSPPKKPRKCLLDKGTGGPVLVDSSSQVRQFNIQNEMSHNLAETQTQTAGDILACISTQTLQSYLENQQERTLFAPHVPFTGNHAVSHRRASANKSDMVSARQSGKRNRKRKSQEIGTSVDLESCCSMNTSVSETQNDHPQHHSEGQFYPPTPRNDTNQQLGVSRLTISSGSSNSQNSQQNMANKYTSSVQAFSTIDPSGADLSIISLPEVTSDSIPECSEKLMTHTDTMKTGLSAVGKSSVSVGTSNFFNDQPSETCDKFVKSSKTEISTAYHTSSATFTKTSVSTSMSSATVTSESNVDVEYSLSTGPTADSEVQTMSASEFSLLLQSSGIYLEEISDSSAKHTPRTVNNYKHVQEDNSYNFLESVAESADMDTQTGTDFNLLDESQKSSDINTQTVEDFDFLDLVMSNSETQTSSQVNDISDLYLSDIQTQTWELDTGIDSDTNTAQTQTGPSVSMATTCTGNDFGHGNGLVESCSTRTASGQTQTNSILSSDSDPLSSVQTQTTYDLLCDLEERLSTVQTQTYLDSVTDSETQTQQQAELFDFDTVNIQTQTTFEDMQNLLFDI